jgi:dihydroorotate dehydrogenase
LAAGFDKRATLIAPMAALGFGHVEVGTITPRPQPGNDRPRLFRLPEDRALINRMGFNSPGMLAVACRLRGGRRPTSDNRESRVSTGGGRSSVVVGVNIGKNRTTALERAPEDYCAAFVAVAPLADYVTLNISSPNTPGLRKLHERAALDQLLGEITTLNRKLDRPRPLFLKISPDETPDQLAEVVEAGRAAGIAGLIATNTTLMRAGLRGACAAEAGGLSGRPLHARARDTIGRLAALAGPNLPVIGAGGVASAAEAYAHIRAGARLVQLYTGLIYEGPPLIFRIMRGLAAQLRRDGSRSLAEAVGTDRL